MQKHNVFEITCFRNISLNITMKYQLNKDKTFQLRYFDVMKTDDKWRLEHITHRLFLY